MKKIFSGKYGLPILLCLFLILSYNKVLNGQVQKNDSLFNPSTGNLKQIVQRNTVSANRWWYSWLVGYSAATVVQSGVALTSSELTVRQDMWNGAATTFLGVVGLLVTPLVPKKSEIDRIVSEGKESGYIYKESDAYEAVLKEIAKREKFGRSWKVHAVTLVVNAGSGLVTWLGFNRSFTDGLVTFALNTVITETQIFTQPIRAVKDYEKYINARNKGTYTGSGSRTPQYFISATPGGVSFRISF